MSNPYHANKKIAKIDGQQVLKEIYNQEDDSITVSSFVSARLGNKVIRADVNATTETYSYYDDLDQLLYTLEIEYVDATQAKIVRVERTA